MNIIQPVEKMVCFFKSRYFCFDN